jgi:hypothetical protein
VISKKKSAKAPPVRNRSLGGKRWSRKEDSRLLELVRQELDWLKIAGVLNRTFSSVQRRFQFLRSFDGRASTIVPKKLTRAERPGDPQADLTCGAVSRSGRQTLNLVRNAIRLRTRETFEPLKEIDLIICAIIRELLLLRLRADAGWLRITISRISAEEHGVGREVFRTLVSSFEKAALIERHVGYPGALALPQLSARKGRLLLIRASSRLIGFCEQQGVGISNVFTHFPSLARK